MSELCGVLKSSKAVKAKTIRGNDWVESSLMTKDIIVETQLDMYENTWIKIMERNDKSGNRLIASFKLKADGTMTPQV